LRLAQQEHVMLVAMHHIVSDGWSIAILLREIAALYSAFLEGKPSPLPKLKIQYADFALWQRKHLKENLKDEQVLYWKQKLQGAPFTLDLPTDRPRSTLRSSRGAMESIILPAKLRERLQRFGRHQQATLFMTLLGGFQVLLFRYTNQRDFVVGTPIANRRRRDTENLIGVFINTLLIRADFSDNPRISEHIARVRNIAVEAYANQDVPFEEAVNALRPERVLTEQPLFQVMFMLRNEPVDAVKLPQLELSFLPYTSLMTAVDLSLSIHEVNDELSCWMLYDTDLFESATIQRMLIHFRNILESMVQDSGERVETVRLLTDGEERQITRAWNSTEALHSTKAYIFQAFENQVERNPDAIAVVFDQQRITYGELNRRANQVARELQSLGVRRGMLVGICMERSLELVVGLLGILKAGAAYVPMDPAYPKERLDYIIADAHVPVLLTQQHLLEGTRAYQARMVCVDLLSRELAERDDRNLNVDLTDDDLAYVIYTSGSTGRPKGAMNTHGGIRNRLLWMQDTYCLGPQDRVLQKTPFSFDVSVWEFFWPLMTGAQLVVARPGGHQDPAYLVRLVREQEITTIHFVPSMMQVFLAATDVGRCKSLRRVICSGETLPLHLKNRFFEHFDCELHNLYGPTEAAVDVTFWECRKDDALPVIPIGRPIANTQMYVLDEWMQPVSAGMRGELYIGGAGVGRGYWHRVELTAEKFVPDPFSAEPGRRLYKTGDLGRYSLNGVIEYLGRIDNQVKIRGHRIELGEIEALLTQHTEVRECVVVTLEDVPGECRLVAYVVPAKQGQKLETRELRRHLQQKLPAYMVPSTLVELETLPLSPNGKVDRRKLPMPTVFREELEPHFMDATTELERQIADIWREVLRLDIIGVNQNFFDLGGSSLHSARVQNILSRRLKLDVTLVELFQFTTIRQLAAHLNRNTEEPSASFVALQRPALDSGNERLTQQLARMRSFNTQPDCHEHK
jgi:amino acid adenylation domain-containing protein